MPEAASFAPRPGGRAVHALLTLVAQDRPERLVLLVARAGRDLLHIEDAYPETALAGTTIAAPPALLEDGFVCLPTEGLRLSLAWTEACGRRPAILCAWPVPDRAMWLVIADGELRDPDRAALSAAAEALAPLIDRGEATRSDQDTASRLSALVDHLPVPLVFVDARRLEVFLNDGARTLLDLAPGDLGNRSVSAALARLVGGTDPAVAKPQLAMEPTASMTFDIRRHGQMFTVDTLWIDRKGLAGRVWQFRDVTRERVYQSELADLAALLQLTVENVHGGVALVDEDMRLILWNEDFLDLFGCPADGVVRGTELLPLLRVSAERGGLGHGEPASILEWIAESTLSTSHRHLEIRRDDGRILDLSRRSLEGGRFILLIRDVTDERQAARLKDDLVSTASHELRTPVSAIAGALALVMSGAAGEIPERARGLLEIAQRNGQRLERLVDDLLDLDKLQLGRMELVLERVDLAALIRDAAEQNAPYADNYGVTIRVEAPAPVLVEADPFRLMQVLTNLLSNAAKFSPRGSEIRIVLAASGGWARISVIDQGRGISPEFRRRIFTRFAQEHGPSPDRPAGSGLGLAISKSIVDAHGGTLELDQTARVGATFHIGLREAG